MLVSWCGQTTTAWSNGQAIPIISFIVIAEGSEDLHPLSDRGLATNWLMSVFAVIPTADATYIWFLPIEGGYNLFPKTH
jgi:hypothetical protein